jgi:hypothetical protein
VLQRGNDVACRHGTAVVERKLRAQCEPIGEPIRADSLAFDHHRFRRHATVERKQRIEHHLCIGAANEVGGQVGIELADIGARNHLQHCLGTRRSSGREQDSERDAQVPVPTSVATHRSGSW